MGSRLCCWQRWGRCRGYQEQSPGTGQFTVFFLCQSILTLQLKPFNHCLGLNEFPVLIRFEWRNKTEKIRSSVKIIVIVILKSVDGCRGVTLIMVCPNYLIFTVILCLNEVTLCVFEGFPSTKKLLVSFTIIVSIQQLLQYINHPPIHSIIKQCDSCIPRETHVLYVTQNLFSNEIQYRGQRLI